MVFKYLTKPIKPGKRTKIGKKNKKTRKKYKFICIYQKKYCTFEPKFLATGILDPVGKKAEVRAHRPPELYAFNRDKYEQLKHDHSMRLEF